jgi:hypothetical protein
MEMHYSWPITLHRSHSMWIQTWLCKWGTYTPSTETIPHKRHVSQNRRRMHWGWEITVWQSCRFLYVSLDLYSTWNLLRRAWTHSIHDQLRWTTLEGCKTPSQISQTYSRSTTYTWTYGQTLSTVLWILRFGLGNRRTPPFDFRLHHHARRLAHFTEFETASSYCTFVLWSRVALLFTLCAPNDMVPKPFWGTWLHANNTKRALVR